MLAEDLLDRRLRRAGIDIANHQLSDRPRLLRELTSGVGLFIHDSRRQQECIRDLEETLVVRSTPSIPPQKNRELRVAVNTEFDIVPARSSARALCRELGFPEFDQVKVATVVSELARNMVQYAGKGDLIIRVSDFPRRGIEITARDHGPGISNLDSILDGSYRSRTGMGKGLRFAKNSMSTFEIATDPSHGTTITVSKYFEH
jgi:serine/threonine-protein kinase RsbT